jgi:hypothetical protein
MMIDLINLRMSDRFTHKIKVCCFTDARNRLSFPYYCLDKDEVFGRYGHFFAYRRMVARTRSRCFSINHQLGRF